MNTTRSAFSQLAIKPCYAAFLIAGWRVRRSRRVPLGRPGPAFESFGGLAGVPSIGVTGVPSIGVSRRNPRRTRAGMSRPGFRCRSQGSRMSSTIGRARRSWVLGVGGGDEPGPAVGLCGCAQGRGSPAQGVLDEPERVLDVETTQIASPTGLQIDCGSGGPLWFPRNRGGFLYAASRLRAAVS